MKKQSNKIIINFLWRFAERTGAQGVSFIVSIVLARLLAPEVYGTIALVTVFITILQVFVDSGFGNSLIQKKDADDLDFSTVFYFNILVCCILYLGMYIAAPFIAGFYEDSQLISVIRVLSLTLIISGIKNVQQAYVSKNMLFKRFFFATLGGTLSAAILGITLAYMGAGIWALVIQQVSNCAIDTVIIWSIVKWHPKRMFSFKRLSSLFSYGWKLLASRLLDTIYINMRQLIIGKMYSSADLAYYNRGQQFPNFIVNNINNSIDSVLFPVMSSVQDNRMRIKEMTRKSIKVCTYIMAPMMMGLTFCAESVVKLILTDTWLACVPFLRIFCITFMFYPVHNANLNAINAMGRSDLFLKLEIMKKVVGLVLLLSTMWFGVRAMAYSLLISSALSQIINSWPNRKLLEYGYIDQLKDIFPSILLSVCMGIGVWSISWLKLPVLVALVGQILLGIVSYIGGSHIFKIDAFEFLKETLQEFYYKFFHINNLGE